MCLSCWKDKWFLALLIGIEFFSERNGYEYQIQLEHQARQHTHKTNQLNEHKWTVHFGCRKKPTAKWKPFYSDSVNKLSESSKLLTLLWKHEIELYHKESRCAFHYFYPTDPIDPASALNIEIFRKMPHDESTSKWTAPKIVRCPTKTARHCQCWSKTRQSIRDKFFDSMEG